MDLQKVKNFIKEKTLNKGRWNYPISNRYNHTMGVLKWAERIQKIEGGDIEISEVRYESFINVFT
ncbi:hypothetical protein [Natronospora cellulosivora (SeqCode)]